MGINKVIIRKQKKVRNLYLRYGDPAFVLFASFSFAAKNQGWSDEEIKEVILDAKGGGYRHLFFTLKKWC